MAYSLNSAAQEIVSYWETQRDIPFKGQLIDKDDNGNVCMCAQGQALHIVGGYTEKQLFEMGTNISDKETARILGISLTHSIFLRVINDKCEGSPQEVLSNPAKYLGPNWEDVLNFWIYLDTLSNKEKDEIESRYFVLDEHVHDYAIDAAWNAAAEVVGREFRNAAWRAAITATGRWVFGYATLELIAHHNLKTPATFIPLISGIQIP
jgi:hypothetical protein